MTPLVLSCFLTGKQPPLELIVSARAVLIAQDGKVFVFEDQGLHVLPGGRRQNAEPLLDIANSQSRKGFVERVKREFAELNGVDVSKVAVEFKIIS